MKTSKLIKILLVSLCLIALSSAYQCDTTGDVNCVDAAGCTLDDCTGDCATGYAKDGDGNCLLCADDYTFLITGPAEGTEGGC